MIEKNRLWIRVLDPSGNPIETATFRFQKFKEVAGGYEVDAGNVIAFTHQGHGFYSISTDESLFGRIEQYIEGDGWVVESESENIVVPSVDLLRHITGSGMNHEVDQISGLQALLDSIDSVLASHSGTLGNHTNRLDTNEGEISDLRTGLENLIPRVTTAENSLNTLEGRVNEHDEKFDALLVDVENLPVAISSVEERDRDIVITFGTGGYEKLFGGFEIAYEIKDDEGWTPGQAGFGRTMSSGSNTIRIDKPAEGHEKYQTGLLGKAVLYLKCRFCGIGGSKSNWSDMSVIVFNEPELTIEKLAQAIEGNQNTMSALADLVANRIVIEAYHKQES